MKTVSKANIARRWSLIQGQILSPKTKGETAGKEGVPADEGGEHLVDPIDPTDLNGEEGTVRSEGL